MGLIVSTLQSIAHALFEPDHNHHDKQSNSKNQSRKDETCKDDPKEPDFPILLIPGIAGSIMHVKEDKQESNTGHKYKDQDDKPDEGTRVWVTVIGAETKFQKLFCRYNHDTQRVEQINPKNQVVIPKNGQDDGGLYAVTTLDPDLLIPLNVVKYFYELINFLKKQRNYQPNSTLFGLGYDYRQPNGSHADAVLRKLQKINQQTGKKVDIITHSMGGLVIQGFLAKYPKEFEMYIRKWVAIACPFQGASGYTIDSLLTGCGFSQGWEEYLVRYLYVHRHTFQQVLSESPAMFDLLPSLDYNWAQVNMEEPTISIFLKKQQPSQRLYPHIRTVASMQNIQKAYITQSQQTNGSDLSSSQAMEFINPVALDKHPKDFSILEQNGTVTRRFQKLDPDQNKLKDKHKPKLKQEQKVAMLKQFISDEQVCREMINQNVSIWPWPSNETSDDDNKIYVLETKFSQFQILMDNILVEHSVHDNDSNQDVSINMNPGCFVSAKEFIQLRDGVQLPPTCEFYNLYGRGTDTPFSIQYGSPEGPLDNLSGVYMANAVYSCVEGDGTVPLYSSIGDNFRSNVMERKEFNGNHRGLLNDANVHNQVLQWIETQGCGDWELL